MKRSGAIAVVLAFLMLGVACNAVSGSGNVVTRRIDVAPFSKLEVQDAFQANVTVGSSETLTVRVDDNLVDSLDVGVSGDTLHVGLDQTTHAIDATLEADVTVRSLSALGGSGASTITLADPLDGSELAISLSGASRLFGAIGIEGGSLELSGASNTSLSGSATTLEVTESGASHIDGRDLSIERLTIDLSGASNAEVTVTGTLSATASGASALRYAGSPTIARSDASGASTIQPID